MTHEEKINYMRIAAGICSYGFKNDQIDLLVSLYELVIDKQGDADLKSIAEIQVAVEQRELNRLQLEKEKTNTNA